MANNNVIEVLIETLHGTAFELLVSPDDTVLSIKTRISRLEGIPVSQQHLIWRNRELSDVWSLRECDIRDGSTIKLVLGMRGGPINTRKASVEDRPTLYEVAKYLDAKGEEVSLSIPKMRAMRMVVMRQGDKVHLYTVVDRPTSGLLSNGGRRTREDYHTPREPSTDETGGPERHQENLVTRQKVDELQRKMRMCRLRKDGKSADDDDGKATRPGLQLPPLQSASYCFRGRRWGDNSCWNRAAPGARAAGVVLPQLMLPVPPGCGHWRPPRQGTSSYGGQEPPAVAARPDGCAGTGAIPKQTERATGAPHSQDNCRKCTALLERMYGLDRRGRSGIESSQCKQPSVLLSLGQMDMPSSAPRGGTGPRPAEGTLDPKHFFKQVLPPVGRQQRRCSCVRPNRPPEQDVATAPLMEPLELDWTERPRTAPTRFVRLPTLRRSTIRSTVSPDEGGDNAGNAKESSGGQSAHDPCCPLATAALLLDDEAPDRAAEAFRRDATSGARKRTPPAGAEGIRWALGDGGRRAATVLSPSRVHVVPLLQRMHDQLWRVDHQLRHNMSYWARLAADNESDDQKDPPHPQGAPPTNGHPNTNPERTSSAEESNTSDMSTNTVAGERSNGSAASASGSNVTLSVDMRGSSSTELSSSGGGATLDEDSNSTSESKTDDGASSADAQHPSPGKAKKKGKRCSWCNKKTGLASTYICRCGNIFCATHRYAEAHACSHDYKAEGRYILQRNNPVVKAAKLPKI